MAKSTRNKTYVIERSAITGKFVSVGRAKGRSSAAAVSTVRSASGRVIKEYHTVKDSSAKTIAKISRKRCAAIKILAKR